MGLSLVGGKVDTATRTELIDSTHAVRDVSARTDSGFVQEVRPRQLSKLSRTTLGDEQIDGTEGQQASIERIYPHVFDEQSDGGEVIVYLQGALRDVQTALSDYSNADLQAVSTRLSQVAAAMMKAQPLTYFNESFGAVVGFIRRATLSAVVSDVSLSALNALLAVLRTMLSNPMLSLDEASDLVERLSEEGWNGAHGVAGEILSVLLDDSELDYAQVQDLLFPIPELADRQET